MIIAKGHKVTGTWAISVSRMGFQMPQFKRNSLYWSFAGFGLLIIGGPASV